MIFSLSSTSSPAVWNIFITITSIRISRKYLKEIKIIVTEWTDIKTLQILIKEKEHTKFIIINRKMEDKISNFLYMNV